MTLTRTVRRGLAALVAAGALCAGPLVAQTIETINPNDFAIDGDLEESPGDQPVYTQDNEPKPESSQTWGSESNDQVEVAPNWSDPGTTSTGEYNGAANTVDTTQNAGSTYGEDDLIGAAEGVFGKGAEGLARMIQDLLKEQGQPNAYIVGREAGGAFVIGARYGSGTLHHKVEGQRKVYWTGPSIGFDAGANAANTFVLVYNLYDSEELYERYPAGEGQAYIVGGLTASYLRKGDVVMIPIRLGAGLRLGVNAGYMKFSKKQRWLPF